MLAITTATSTVRIEPGLKQETDVELPVKTEQLQAEGGIAPVVLSCGTAGVTASNRLNGFSCTLVNNTGKVIVAANLSYSIVYEQDGKESRDTRFHTLVTSIHPDFYDKAKSIPPGGTSVINSVSLTYEDSKIKEVGIYIDYVEFEDGTGLGPNQNGSRFIKDFRDGASKYKKLLAEKYQEKSIDAAIELLQSDNPLPESEFKSSYQEQGASFYRRRLRKINETRGRAEVQKYLAK
jgi:hypothetical protein